MIKPGIEEETKIQRILPRDFVYDKDDGGNSNIVSEAGEGQGWMLIVLGNYKVLKWIILLEKVK